MSGIKLHYVLDPMCSWCWAFRPSWQALLGELPEQTRVEYIMGGLAPDSDEPMPRQMQVYLQSVWQSIAAKSGAQFNLDFWRNNKPRRSTYPACRAVIAAGFQSHTMIPKMIYGIQKAYYIDARNPSDKDTLVQMAGEIDLDKDKFSNDFNSAQVENEFQNQLQTTQRFGVQGFPCVIVQRDRNVRHLVQGYCDKETLLQRWQIMMQG